MKIDKGIEYPNKHDYPFEFMLPSDSFLVHVEEACEIKPTRSRLSSAAWKAGKKLGMKFSVKFSPQESGFRVWRLADAPIEI